MTIYVFIFLMLGASLPFGNASPPAWENPQGLQNTMTIYAKIKLESGQFIEADQSILAAFKDEECRGIKTIMNGPAGKFFQLSVASDKTDEPGFTLKVYDADSEQIYDIQETFDFKANKAKGKIFAPETYTAEGGGTGPSNAPDWANPPGLENTMTLHAKVRLDADQFVESDGSMLAAFKNDECRGVITIAPGPAGKWFQLSVASNETDDPGLVLKIYDAGTDQIYDVQETVDFEANKSKGSITDPLIYTVGAVSPLASVTIDESGGVSVSEGGSEDTYTIVLDAEPSGNVTITFSTDAQLEVSADGDTEISFTTETWNQARTVTATAADDAAVEEQHSSTISHAASGGGYDDVQIPDVTVTISDNDTLPEPDIIVLNQNTSPTKVTADSSTTASCTIRNQGEASSDSSTLTYYLSENTTYDANDVGLDSADISALAAAGTSSESDSLTIPSGTSPGIWYILFVADAGDTVTESDENNNVSSRQIEVLTPEAPHLSVTPKSLTIPKTEGEATFQIENAGTGTMHWEAATDALWFSITPISGTNNETVKVTYTTNSSEAERSGTITVTSSDAENSPQTLEVIQIAEIEYKGDVNQNGIVELRDAIVALKVVTGIGSGKKRSGSKAARASKEDGTLAFADSDAKYAAFMNQIFSLKSKALEGIASSEDVRLTNEIARKVSEANLSPEKRMALLDKIAGVKHLYPTYLRSRSVRAPRSDVTHPELTSLEITPSVLDVTDGPKDIVFTATAEDDLSAVDNVVIWLDRETPEGYTFVGLWSGWDTGQGTRTYTFPEHTAPGEYNIEKVIVEDSAENERTYLPAELSSMGFPVKFSVEGSGTGDNAAPELKSLEIAPLTVNVSDGPEDMVFTATGEDDFSGVDNVVIWLDRETPAGYSFIGLWTGWDAGHGSRAITFETYTEAAEYNIERITIEDQAGNERRYLPTELVAMGIPTKFSVKSSGTGDTTSPELTSLVITPLMVDISDGAKNIVFTATATDDRSGVDNMVIWLDQEIPNSYSFVGLWSDWEDGQDARTYTIPNYSMPGEYNILTVTVEDKAQNIRTYETDELAEMGIPAKFSVTMGGGTVPDPPSADAGPEQTVDEGTGVILDASGSSDPNGQQISYLWEQQSGMSVSLSDTAAVRPSFTAPNTEADGETLVFQVTVANQSHLESSDTVTVYVSDTDSFSPPVADAGSVQTVDEGNTVTLDASGSSDPKGEQISYLWEQQSGMSVTLSDTAAVRPSFTAPDTEAEGETLVFQVTVTNQSNLESRDTVTVYVSDTDSSSPPTADAGSDQTVDEGNTVILDASGSSDPNGEQISYLWEQQSGMSVSLSDAAAVRPSFTAPDTEAEGEALTFQLTVMNQSHIESSDTVTVYVADTDSFSPTADASSEQTVNGGNTVILDGSGSSDPDNDITSYLWEQMSGPRVTISDAETDQASFIAPEGGLFGETLIFRLTITNGRGLQSEDSVTIHVSADTTDTDMIAADVNGDGKIGIEEVIYILSRIAE